MVSEYLIKWSSEIKLSQTNTLYFHILESFLYADTLSPNEPLPSETFPKLPKEIDNVITYFEGKSIPPNTTINLNNASETNGTCAARKTIRCFPSMGSEQVEIVNDTYLLTLLTPDANITNRDSPGLCIMVMFYSKTGTFSSMAAPHFNALPRAFPDIKMVAINTMMYHLINTQNGIVGIPSLILFHNGKGLAKYNYSEYTLELFSSFLTQQTGIKPKEKSTVTSADFAGPVISTPSYDSDIFLILSWLFVIFCATYYFMKSSWWTWILESIQNNWREAEDQAEHLHND